MTGLRYASLILSTITRSTYVYSLFDPRNGGLLLYQLYTLFPYSTGALTYDLFS